MGAMLTGVQQAHHASYEALMLFGFGTKGLVVALSEEEKRFAGDPAGTRANLVRLARLRSPDPYPPVPRTQQGRDLFAGATADRRGVEALNRVRAELLLTAGLYSMIPGSVLPECAQIKVPLLLALGDRDMAGPPHEVPASYPGSSDITLLVLPATGHAHFLFDSRHHLFDRAASLVRGDPHGVGRWRRSSPTRPTTPTGCSRSSAPRKDCQHGSRKPILRCAGRSSGAMALTGYPRIGADVPRAAGLLRGRHRRGAAGVAAGFRARARSMAPACWASVRP